jgi:hypothetical protein
MSTADCERGFSVLQRVKTSSRNRLSNKLSECPLGDQTQKTFHFMLHVTFGLAGVNAELCFFPLYNIDGSLTMQHKILVAGNKP